MKTQEMNTLRRDVEDFVTGPGEAYAEQIERTTHVPAGLWEDLRGRGFLSLTAPARYGGQGIGFSQYLELVELFSMSQTMGVRGTDHAHLVFDRAPVPVANRLGEEGQGLEVALGGFLTPSRISVAMSCVGLSRRAQELAVVHALGRETFGKPLAARQAIKFMLAENATDIEAARQLTLYAARQWEAGAPDAPKLSSMAKLNAVEALTRVTDKALQIHGGIGFWESSPIARVYRDARAQRFEEGTNEIQKTVISRYLVGGGAS